MPMRAAHRSFAERANARTHISGRQRARGGGGGAKTHISQDTCDLPRSRSIKATGRMELYHLPRYPVIDKVLVLSRFYRHSGARPGATVRAPELPAHFSGFPALSNLPLSHIYCLGGGASPSGLESLYQFFRSSAAPRHKS